MTKIPKTHTRWRWLKRGLFAFAALVTLLALAVAIENWRGAREWKRVRDELRKKGEPLSFAELIPPMPPNDENFASVPLFDGLFDKSIDPKTGKPVWQEKEQQARLPKWLGMLKDRGRWWPGGSTSLAWDKSITNRGSIALEDIEQGANRNVWGSMTTNHTIDGVDIVRTPIEEAVSKLLESSRPVMDEIERAVRRPKSQFPIHYEDNAGAILPHLSLLKQLSKIFSLRAQVRLSSGDSAGAMQDATTTLLLSDSIRDEPFLISGLVRIAMFNEALWPIWKGLSSRVWNEVELRKLQSELGQLHFLASYQHCLRGERIMGIDYANALEHERDLKQIIHRQTGLFDDTWVHQPWFFPRGWFDHNKAVMVDLDDQYLLPAIDVVKQRFYPKQMRTYADHVDSVLEHDWKLFVYNDIHSFSREAPIKFAVAQTQANLAIIACALERYSFKEGHYPETPAALVPAYVAVLPHDLIDGNPLRYRAAGRGYLLYSIGYNGTDDNGEVATQVAKGITNWVPERGDWVWKYTRPSK